MPTEDSSDDADAAALRSPEQHRAFDEAYSAYRPQMMRLVRGLLPREDAEQAVHDTFLDHWRRPERFDSSRGPLGAYLQMCCRGRAIDILRANSARGRRDDVWEHAAARLHVELDFDSHREELRDALAALPLLQREPIVVAFFTGASYVEVAQRLGVPEGTVKARIRAGLLSLRRALADAAVEADRV